MSSARLYLLLLLGIVILVGASGGLGYYFFAILPQRRAEAQRPAPTLSEVDDLDSIPTTTDDRTTDGAPEPIAGSGDRGSWAIGPSGRERKFGFKSPSMPPPAGGGGPLAALDRGTSGRSELAVPARSQRSAGDDFWSDDLCNERGGPFDLQSNPGSLQVHMGPGEVMFDLNRERQDTAEDADYVCKESGREYAPHELDERLRIPIRLNALTRPDAPPSPSSAPRPETETEKLTRWHQGPDREGFLPPTTQPPPDGALAAGVRNFAFGDDPTAWFSDMGGTPLSRRNGLIQGLNAVCYADDQRLELVFTIAPDMRGRDIELAVDGAEGSAIGPSGNLDIDIPGGHIIKHAPRAYEIVDGTPVPLDAGFGKVDERIALQISPETVPGRGAGSEQREHPSQRMLSYLGGTADDQAYAVAVDHKGFTYAAGETTSRRFAGVAPGVSKAPDDVDVFITKFRSSDGHPVFTTFLGGTSEDRALALLTLDDGSLVVVGETLSTDFPSVNALPDAPAKPSWDVFVTRLDATGKIDDFSTRLGGDGDDRAFSVTTTPDGDIVLAGATTSETFPTTTTYGPGGAEDAFVAWLPPGRPPVITRLGGTGNDTIYGVATDPQGRIYVTGETSSRNLPTGNTDSAPLGATDAFLGVFEPGLTNLVSLRYLGGENDDRAYGLCVDATGNPCIVGETASGDLPILNAAQPAFGGGAWDAFVMRFQAGSLTPVTVSYYGGTGDDRAFSVAADGRGSPHLVGETSSTNLPANASLQAQHGGGTWDGFVMRLDPSGRRILYASYVGGDQVDRLTSAAIEMGQYLHVAGTTASTNLNIVNPMQNRLSNRGDDALLATFAPPSPPGPDMVHVPAGEQPGGPNYDFHMSRYETTNAEFVRFLNDAQANTNNARGTNLFFDAKGNIWFNPAMQPEAHEVFKVADSRIAYRPEFPIGMRYTVTSKVSPTGGSYTNHPATGVSWYGAVKYCNWLTIDTGMGRGQRCFREGTNAWDWAPVTSTTNGWSNGVFTAAQREDWQRFKGYRLPMDNCGSSSSWEQVSFRVSNTDFVRFLNDVESTGGQGRGANVWIDNVGNAWFNSARAPGRDELFIIRQSAITYQGDVQAGARFAVAHDDSERAVRGVTPYGAMKYCNWLTLASGLPAEEQCYRESPWRDDWAPATLGVLSWRRGSFSRDAFTDWAALRGARLPLDRLPRDSTERNAAFTGTRLWANPFNEFYAAAAWGGTSNVLYGFGRSQLTARDANYLDSGRPVISDTADVGYYGSNPETQTNANRYGIFDLSGNVTEWSIDPRLTGSAAERSALGGSWRFPLPTLIERSFVHPYTTSSFVGIRTVRAGDGPRGNMVVVRIPYHICLCPGTLSQAEIERIRRQGKDLTSQALSSPPPVVRDDDDATLDVDEDGLPRTIPDGALYKPSADEPEPPPPDDDDDDDDPVPPPPPPPDDDDDDDDDRPRPPPPPPDDDDDDDDDDPVVSPSGV